MKWTLDQFDTSIFGVPSYKSSSPITPIGKGFYTTFAPVDPTISEVLTRYGFRLISVRNTYLLGTIEPEVAGNKIDLSIEPFSRKITLSPKEMTALGKPIWEFSRYRRDRALPAAKSLEFYRVWVENSLYHGYADNCFVAKDGEKIVGFCTIKIKKGDGYVDLLGVLPRYRRKHIGSRLIDRALVFLSKRVKRIFVVTEGENVPANRLYQKKGFIIDHVELVYHKHI